MDRFFEKIFDIHLTAGIPSIPLIVWGIYIGVMIAVALSLISRVYSHRIVSALIKAGADCRDNAKTYGELALGNSFMYKLIFRRRSPLARYIRLRDDGAMYIPEERRIGAELRFSSERAPVVTFVLAAVIFFAAGCAVIIYLPQLLDAYESIWQ